MTNLEQFEAAFLALLHKYQVRQAILLVRSGPALALRAYGATPADNAGAEVLSTAVENLMTSKEIRDKCRAAMKAVAE